MIEYSNLTITQFVLKDGRYRVDGLTDLPNGTKLVVSIKAFSDTSFNLQKTIEVHNSSFTAFFAISSENSSINKKMLVEVFCNPQKQNSGLINRIDHFGKNFVGESMIILGKLRILKRAKIFELL